MLKRILSCLVIICIQISFLFPSSSFAKSVDNTQSILDTFWTEKGEFIIKKLEKTLQKISKNEKTLYEVLIKYGEKQNILLGKENLTEKERLSSILLGYILDSANKSASVWPKEVISDKEKEQIEEKILSLQRNLLTNTSIKSFRLQDGSETKGNFKWDLHIDTNFIGNLFGKIELNDLFIKIKWLDTDISGELKIALTSSGETSHLETKLQVIEKEGNQYMKIEDFSSTWEENVFIKSMAQGFEQMKNANSFIKTKGTSVNQTTQIAENIQKLLPNYLQKLKDEALFTPYKKINESFVLVPSKALCSLEKNILWTQWEECSDSEYALMLEAYLHMNLLFSFTKESSNGTFNLVWNTPQGIYMFGKIILQNEQIQSLWINITPDQISYPGEGISLSYDGSMFDLKAKVAKFIFGTRLKWDLKNFSGEYTFSLGGQGLIQWIISQKSSDSGDRSFTISADGENLISEGDNLSAKALIQVSNETQLLFDISGKYLQWLKEVFGGSFFYDVSIKEAKEIQIVPPSEWIDIKDLGNTLKNNEEFPQ